MPYLRKVTISNNEYYYLFHTIREGDKYKKISKYLGKEKPADSDLQKLKSDFLAEINKEPRPIDEKNPSPNVVALLLDLQEKKGYLSKEDMKQLSKEMDIPGVNIYGVATFYSQFRLSRHGKYTINLCRGTACHVKNSQAILESIESLLNIKKGQTTKDCKFTIETVNCIGACAKAPAMMINGVVYGELTRDKVNKILSELP